MALHGRGGVTRATRRLRSRAGDPADRLAARRCRDGDPCEQGRRQLLRLRAWHRGRAAVHDRGRRGSCGRRRHGAGPRRGPTPKQVDVVSSGTAAIPITFAEAPGRHGDGPGRRARVPDQLEELGHHPWVHGRRHDRTRDQRDRVGSHITIEGNEVSGAGERPVTARSAGASRSRPRPTRSCDATSHARQLRRRHLPRRGSDRERHRRQHQLRRTPAGTSAPRSASTSAPPRTTVTANLTFDNEDSGINIWNGADGSLVTNNVSYRNGDHGIDNKGSNNTRILSNTVYGGANSGIEVVNSTGVALANNISVDNGIDSPAPRATSSSTRPPRRPSPWTTTSCSCRVRAS